MVIFCLFGLKISKMLSEEENFTETTRLDFFEKFDFLCAIIFPVCSLIF